MANGLMSQDSRRSSDRFHQLFRVVSREVTTVVATLFGLLLITFMIGHVMPIDPVLAVVGDKATPEVYNAAKIALGLDKPLYEQFFIYISQVAHGDFGTSMLTSNKVIDDIAHVFPATIELATLGMLIGVAIGLPLGITAAVFQGRWPDQLARLVGLIGYSVPVFWFGLVGLLFFYVKLDWVSGPGRQGLAFQDMVDSRTGLLLIDSLIAGDWDSFKDAFSHIILPAVVLGLFSLAYISRMMRSFMVTELKQQYVITARVKGMSETRVVLGHALRNAAVPLFTVIAVSYANLLEGSVLVETIFAWPGLGRYITTALLMADMNAVLGGTLVIGAIFIMVNLLSDMFGRLADPRTR